jgi:hypothetical protein
MAAKKNSSLTDNKNGDSASSNQNSYGSSNNKGEVNFESTAPQEATQSTGAGGRAFTADDGTQTSSTTRQSSWAPRYTYQTSDNASMNSSMPSMSRNETKKQRKNAKDELKSNQPSLTERMGNSALSSTIGILKLFGDVTLSTTGTILSPSLEVTRHVLLPQLFAALADYISNISPQRLKDWFRIVSASVHHLIAVIVSTDRGSVFRQKFVRAFGGAVDVASSDTSRQAVMDGMACFVKFSEALQ